jgi:hypothetical protein
MQYEAYGIGQEGRLTSNQFGGIIMRQDLIELQKRILEALFSSGNFTEEYVSIESGYKYTKHANITIRIDFPEPTDE